jgi:hypothetical protein
LIYYIYIQFKNTSLELTDEAFEMDRSFDAERYFSEYFGVMTDDRIPLQRLVLRAYGNERFAMKDLPLHNSQKLRLWCRRR